MSDLYIVVNITDKDGVLLDSFRVLPGRLTKELNVNALSNEVRNIVELHCETQED